MKNKKIISIVLAIIIFVSFAPITLGAFGGIIRILVEPTLVFNAVYTFRDGMAWVQRDGRVGFVDRYGEVVIPLEFDSASHFFCEGLARVGAGSRQAGWTYGFIDMEGNLVIPYLFSYAGCFHYGVARVGIGGKFGVIDTSGQVVVPIEYDWIDNIRYGLIVARIGDWQDGKSGVMDKTGNIIVPFEFSSIFILEDGLIYARKGDWSTGSVGIFNRYGDILVPFEYNHIHPFHEGLAAVIRDGKIGFVDKSGNLVIPLMYGSLGNREVDPRWMSRWSHHGSFEDGMAVVSRRVLGEWSRTAGSEFGLIDKMGNIILPFEFDVIHSFSEGLAVVGVGEMIFADDEDEWGDLVHTFGVIDVYGNFVIPLEYEFIRNFSEGVASAGKNGQTGLIDRYGNVVLPFEYSWINRFENGVATANKDGNAGVIDRYGNIIVPFEFSWIGRFENGMANASKDGKNGMIDLYGNFIVPFEYDSIQRFGYDLLLARRGHWQTGALDFIDSTGQVIYALPENTILSLCTERNRARNGGLYWISTGDREAGFQFGILEIVTAQYDDVSQINLLWLLIIVMIICCAVFILVCSYLRKGRKFRGRRRL